MCHPYPLSLAGASLSLVTVRTKGAAPALACEPLETELDPKSAQEVRGSRLFTG